MSDQKFELKPIRFAAKEAGGDGLTAGVADETFPAGQFSALAALIEERQQQRYSGTATTSSPVALVAAIGDFLQLARNLDNQYGSDGDLPVVDAADAIDETLRCLTELDSWLDRLDLADQHATLHAIQLGVGYWAMRHDLPIHTSEPIVNALAEQSNRAGSRQETAATYALMQGFILHLKPALQADLEQSNPERPWRLLNLNFAITAIRTGDADMIRFAFDTLNMHLPAECAGFYAAAHSLACQPGFPEETRALIEIEHARWTRPH